MGTGVFDHWLDGVWGVVYPFHNATPADYDRWQRESYKWMPYRVFRVERHIWKKS